MEGNMNKGQLVDRMAKSAGISKTAADKALNGFMEAVTESLNAGEKVTLVGFGTFSVTKRKARTGRNPRTGKPMEIPAKKVVKFKPGTKLSESIE
jgi:DNA-binding protein HU-beta